MHKLINGERKSQSLKGTQPHP